MDEIPSRPVHKKRHNVFGRLKNALTRQSRDTGTPTAALKPSASTTSGKPDAERAPVDVTNGSSKIGDLDAKNYWQMAYDELTEGDRKTLETLLAVTAAETQNAGRSRTKEILNEVIKATEAQYEAEQSKDGLRATAYKILHSTLSFQDVINTAVKFDPTGYASSAWAMVSLGLTVWSPYNETSD
jgi:hypothetical protein